MNHNGEMTHCRRGHEFTPENTYYTGRGNQRRCRACSNTQPSSRWENRKDYLKQWESANRERVRYTRRKSWLRKLGWTPELFEQRRKEQSNKCAICSVKLATGRGITGASADHKHGGPPKPRGVLCGGCNWALGLFKDNPEVLRKAADYLEKWSIQHGPQSAKFRHG